MSTYIKEIAKELLDLFTTSFGNNLSDHPGFNVQSRFRSLAQELDRLIPSDFAPVSRAKCVNLRRIVRNLQGMPNESWAYFHRQIGHGLRDIARPDRIHETIAEIEAQPLEKFEQDKAARYLHLANGVVKLAKAACNDVVSVLDDYGGPGSGAVMRSFAFIHDNALRAIIERDYLELTRKLFPSEAWKSTVVMAGSILEAILQDCLGQATTAALANKYAPASVKRFGPVEDGHWDLANLIDAAADTALNVITPINKESTTVLRKYRNFVHPENEKRTQRTCTQAEAMIAVGALNSVCDHLTP